MTAAGGAGQAGNRPGAAKRAKHGQSQDLRSV